jgi:cephalosporin hydroxylase
LESPRDIFLAERDVLRQRQGADPHIRRATQAWIDATAPTKYSYHFDWMGRPIIQYPQDMIAMQEIIWRVQPDLIIETGVAHGGSLIYYSSLLELIGNGTVLGIDIDIRPHNRAAIEAHPMMKRIRLIQGSSTAPEIVSEVRTAAAGKRVLVTLDSNHTHDHVLAELEAYAPLVAVGSYCVVMDTIVEDMPTDAYPDRPWGRGNNPKTAVHAYLAGNPEFEIDKTIEDRLLITVAPSGYLKRVR